MGLDPLTAQLIEFVRSAGIAVRTCPLDDTTFLPGLDIQSGTLLIDAARLAYPGDILHEAGHIAVADAERRMQPVLKPTKAEEMAAMAWSYAAIRHLNLPPDIVFHGHGYQQGNRALIEAYRQGTGPGLPMLIWFGVTACPHGRQPGDASQPFPRMDRWLR
ncbi:hypothetical protein ACN2XU_03660 [Primorskyibacter sp. 2E107]|uniref:hypothetical protein n=1 Tax=Primorskyibacter sp. 2E107 TaxID=3403458 RepID=UPI003AF4A37F